MQRFNLWNWLLLLGIQLRSVSDSSGYVHQIAKVLALGGIKESKVKPRLVTLSDGFCAEI